MVAKHPLRVDNENTSINSYLPMKSFQQLAQFRQDAYNLLGPACDATFELIDAVLLTGTVSSFAELSLSPVFRRKWPSIYEALEDCRPSRQKLMTLYIDCIPEELRPLFAVDHTGWPRE